MNFTCLLVYIYIYIYQHLGVILGGGRFLQRAPCVCVGSEHGGGGSCIRQHTSAYAIREYMSGYVRIRQHTSAYVSIRQHTSAYVNIRVRAAAARAAAAEDENFKLKHRRGSWVLYSSVLRAYVSIRQQMSAYVSIRQHAGKLGIILEGRGNGLALYQHPYYIRCFVPLRMRAS